MVIQIQIIKHVLWSTNIPLNSWQLKSDRSSRISVKGLHSFTDPDDINGKQGAATHVGRNVYNPTGKSNGYTPNILLS